jgi:hypothetical protein
MSILSSLFHKESIAESDKHRHYRPEEHSGPS